MQFLNSCTVHMVNNRCKHVTHVDCVHSNIYTSVVMIVCACFVCGRTWSHCQDAYIAIEIKGLHQGHDVA